MDTIKIVGVSFLCLVAMFAAVAGIMALEPCREAFVTSSSTDALNCRSGQRVEPVTGGMVCRCPR